MFNAPLLFIYLLYLLFLIGFFVFSAFGLYHLEEYGYVGDYSRTMSIIYVAVAGSIMLATFALLVATFF